jgi:hypothetical protein
MQKAQLAGGQIVAAVLAGFLANLLFSAGWTLVGVSVFGGIIVSLVGVSLPRLVGSFVDAEQLEQVVSRAGAALGVIAIVIVVIGVLLMALGVVASGLILRAGKARRPWAVTWSAIGISALLGLPLLLLFATIAGRRDDAGFVLVSFLGTSIVGILLWLWMTWARRGPLVTDPAIAAAPAAPALAQPEAPALEKPAADAPAAEKKTATKPTAAKPAAAKPAAAKPAAKAATAKAAEPKPAATKPAAAKKPAPKSPEA